MFSDHQDTHVPPHLTLYSQMSGSSVFHFLPVLVGPVMARSWSPDGELSNMSFENAAILAEAGVPLGFTGGFEGYVPKVRVVLWEAAVAAANGLGAERALHALTLGGATAVGREPWGATELCSPRCRLPVRCGGRRRRGETVGARRGVGRAGEQCACERGGEHPHLASGR